MSRAVEWKKVSLKTIKDWCQKFTSIEITTMLKLFVIIFLIYYVVEGFGKSVFTEFRIPKQVDKDFPGVEGQILTHQLMGEILNIRTVQESARSLNINLVRDVPFLSVAGDPLRVDLSARINSDYKEIIANIGTFEWGPLRIPAGLLLRPFQKLIRQKAIQLNLTGLKGNYTLTAISDGGGLWQVTQKDLGIMETTDKSSSESLFRLIRALAYKIAFSDGLGYQSQERWRSFYHYHQGVCRLLDYYLEGRLSAKDRYTLIEGAVKNFGKAYSFNSSDKRSLYNLILASLVQSTDMQVMDRIQRYQDLLPKMKNLYETDSSLRASVTNLFVVTYIMLGETYLEAWKPSEAIQTYESVLELSDVSPDIKAYIHNNIGFAYRLLGKLEMAIHHYNKSLTYNSSYARAYVNLGISMMSKGDFTGAERYYAEAIEKRPDFLPSYYNLGKLYFDMEADGALERVDQDCRKCLQGQALAALEKYASTLQKQGITRNFSNEEKEGLNLANGWLQVIGRAGLRPEGIHRVPPYGRCLKKNDGG